MFHSINLTTTMKNLLVITGLGVSIMCAAQIDKDKLALDISKAEDANTDGLKEYIWKRKSDISVNGEVKLTTYTEFNFDEQGKLQAKLVDAESNVKQKGGLRGKAQKNAAEDKLEYVQKTLE